MPCAPIGTSALKALIKSRNSSQRLFPLHLPCPVSTYFPPFFLGAGPFHFLTRNNFIWSLCPLIFFRFYYYYLVENVDWLLLGRIGRQMGVHQIEFHLLRIVEHGQIVTVSFHFCVAFFPSSSAAIYTVQDLTVVSGCALLVRRNDETLYSRVFFK